MRGVTWLHGYRLSDVIRETAALISQEMRRLNELLRANVKGRKIMLKTEGCFRILLKASFKASCQIRSAYGAVNECDHHSTYALRWDHVFQKNKWNVERLSPSNICEG